ncbi:MAG: MBL fold metallo-hydrolase [Promethearchaeia archaeon]
MTKIKWISHACFKMKTDEETVIYLDPYEIPESGEKADIIVSSHSHYDHFDVDAIKNVIQDTTKVIGPKSMSNKLKQFGGKGLDLGEKIEIKELLIKLVPAYTIEKSTHPKENEWAGIIIKIGENKIYHAGDTERIPEMEDLKGEKIDVALLPCGGNYTMDMKEASEAAIDIVPKIVVPMHNWDKDMNQMKDILAKKNPEIQVKILSQNKGFII